jgi:FkbM family methyltransferase
VHSPHIILLDLIPMKNIKKLLKSILLIPQVTLIKLYFLLESLVELLLPVQISRAGRNILINKVDEEYRLVKHECKSGGYVSFNLHTPNEICLFRRNSFSDKEPEMLEWIEEFGGDGAFFDIGANVGIYSIYYAKLMKGNVYSFEPSVFNLKQLAKNISVNSLSKQIHVISNPLSDKTGFAPFINSNVSEGGALNSFGVTYGFDGNEIDNIIEYSLLGFSLDEMFEIKILTEVPTCIKIDVDGIEHLILSGSRKILENKTCKSVFIEVNESFKEQSESVEKYLTGAGFILREKRRSEYLSNSAVEEFWNISNQIWVRSGV